MGWRTGENLLTERTKVVQTARSAENGKTRVCWTMNGNAHFRGWGKEMQKWYAMRMRMGD
jgi:hypothetical protein